MKWQRSHTLVAGVALIVATNAVVLAGVAYNRSGEPQAVLPLTERELSFPFAWGLEKENSGISLRLDWRMDGDWLNRAKLASLGFDVSEPALIRGRQPPRDALLVLELDGQAYRAALAEAEQRAKLKPEEWNLRALRAEQEKNSRLFVVDVGLDAAALRTKYPNRTQYAIVRGRVAPAHRSIKDAGPVTGRVDEVNIVSLHVPVGMHAVVRPDTAYRATLAFGKRLEPWLKEASAGAR